MITCLALGLAEARFLNIRIWLGVLDLCKIIKLMRFIGQVWPA